MRITNPLERIQKAKRNKNAAQIRESFDAIFGPESQLNKEGRLNAFIIWWNTWGEAEKASVLYQELGTMVTLFSETSLESKHRKILDQALRLTFSADADSGIYALLNGVSGEAIVQAFLNGDILVGRQREEQRERNQKTR